MKHDLLTYAARQAARVQLGAGHRRCAGQGRHRLLRGRGDACPRSRHHIGPRRRGGARRASLRAAADGAVRRRLDQPRRRSRSTTRATMSMRWSRRLHKAREMLGCMDAVAARTLPGNHPRSFAPSAPFRRAGRRDPQGRGIQSAVRRPGDDLSEAGRGRPHRRHQFEGKGCAISQASASLMTDMLKGRTSAEAEKLMGGSCIW